MSTKSKKCGALPTRVIRSLHTLSETGKLNHVDPYAWFARDPQLKPRK